MSVSTPKLFRSSRWLTALVAAVCLASGAIQAQTLSSEEAQVYSYLKNASGQQRPRDQIHTDPILTSVARSRAADMANRDYFDHVNPDGVGPNYLVRKAGYVLPDWWGTDPAANYIESIGGGYSSASGVWDGWMNSSGHKTHLLALDSFYQNQTAVGVGHVYNANSRYKHYWVVITAPPGGPMVKITSPAWLSRTLASQINVTGRATQSPAVVEYSIENLSGTTAFQPVQGTDTWSADVSGLIPGRNKIVVRSRDNTGKILATDAVIVKQLYTSNLHVDVVGEGTVTDGFAGDSLRVVGRRYAIRAVPADGWVFAGWTGAKESPRKRLYFRMAEGTQLTATFVPAQ